ncbi:MAG TPA: hypothetical protein VM638_05710, partial [Actinomycetota bacterium]|nr:hypothetical protein [Actinomycetota bacterium]
MRRWLPIVAILLATLPAPSLGGPPPEEELAELLRERAEAMRRGDLETYLASVAPDVPDFRRRQRRL